MPKLSVTGRNPEIIDNSARKRFKSQILMPNHGYRSKKKRKHILPCGFRKFLVHNVTEMKLLL
jgi:large subunit ribosomal protein L32e